MSVHATDAFRHATELMGTEIWSFCQHAKFYFAERRGLSWFSCWKGHHENAEENSTAYERLSRTVYRFSARLRISTYQLHAGMIFTTLFLPYGKKFLQKVLKIPWEIIFKKCLPRYENSTLFLKTSSENFFVKLRWQMRHVFNKFSKIMWKHDKRMKIELHISKC